MASQPSEIAVEELARILQEGGACDVLDVRENWERDICEIPESRHIPMGQIPGKFAEIPVGRPVVVVCHHGIRSARVTAWLRAQGFENAVNLTGGIDAWARRVDPGMATY